VTQSYYANLYSLVNAGRVGPEQSKRFYKFALIDPIDQPFATFRYYYRSWNQLRKLGLLEQDISGTGEEDDLPVIEPQEGIMDRTKDDIRPYSTISKKSEDVFQDCKENFNHTRRVTSATDIRGQTISSSSPARPRSVKMRRPSTQRASLRRVSDTEQPRAYIPRGAPSLKIDTSAKDAGEQAQQRDSFVGTPTQLYRLSIPPSIKLGPPEPASRPLPTLLIKNDFEAFTSYRPHPAYPVDDWTVRTPSPVKSVRDGISTPPPGRRKEQGRSASALMNAITSSWRRRNTQTRDGKGAIKNTEDVQGLP
jgi:hypothetical protein